MSWPQAGYNRDSLNILWSVSFEFVRRIMKQLTIVGTLKKTLSRTITHFGIFRPYTNRQLIKSTYFLITTVNVTEIREQS